MLVDRGNIFTAVISSGLGKLPSKPMSDELVLILAIIGGIVSTGMILFFLVSFHPRYRKVIVSGGAKLAATRSTRISVLMTTLSLTGFWPSIYIVRQYNAYYGKWRPGPANTWAPGEAIWVIVILLLPEINVVAVHTGFWLIFKRPPPTVAILFSLSLGFLWFLLLGLGLFFSFIAT